MSRIRQVAERCATPLPKLTGELATLAARVDKHPKKMGAVRNEDLFARTRALTAFLMKLSGAQPAGEVAELSQAGGPVEAVDDEPVARTLARRYGVTDASAARAIEMVERVLRLPLMDEARAATKIFREVPLAGNTAGGRTQGKPDLLFERSGEWKVVDFKTDRLDGPDAVEKYAAQLAGYSSSLAGVVGAEVKPAICLVRQGEVVELR